jgi:hypothetical protein
MEYHKAIQLVDSWTVAIELVGDLLMHMLATSLDLSARYDPMLAVRRCGKHATSTTQAAQKRERAVCCAKRVREWEEEHWGWGWG